MNIFLSFCPMKAKKSIHNNFKWIKLSLPILLIAVIFKLNDTVWPKNVDMSFFQYRIDIAGKNYTK